MSDGEKIIFKTTLAKLITYTAGVVSICSTCFWGVNKITNSLSMLEYRIQQQEARQASHEDSDNRLHAEIWRNLKDQQNQILDIYKKHE